MSTHRFQLIEFAGPPGSGKTTIAQATRELFHDQNIPLAEDVPGSALLANRPLGIYDVLQHVWLLRYLTPGMLNLLALRRSSKDPERTRFVRRVKDVVEALVLRRNVQSIKRNGAQHCILRSDGNLGRIALFFARGIVGRRRALSILRGLYPPRTLFVIVNTPAQETIRRQLERGTTLSLNPAVPLSEQSDSIDAFYSALHDLAQELKTTHDCDVATLDGTAPSEHNTHRIAELV
ncbi:MAG: hypothetical protein WDZ79_01315 [Candidatus Paceibacterota bacterium]